MDLECILHGCAAVAADLVFLGIFYNWHKEQSKCLKNLKSAVHIKTKSDLMKKVKANGGTVPYAVVTGKVEAVTMPILSEYSGLRGVIQERIISEEKVKWIPSLRIWHRTSNNNIQYKLFQVPFQLVTRPSIFHKKIAIEIVDPMTSEELVIPQVFSDYKKYDVSLREAVIGLLSSEHTVGIRETENMLLEGTPMTAVGKLTLENGSVKMACPDDGSTYYLASTSFDTLVKKIDYRVKLSRGLTIVMFTATGILLAYLTKKAVDAIQRKITHRKDLRRREEELRLSRINAKPQTLSSTDIKCVVCLENPVEVVILDCGHACLCWICSYSVDSSCPICRSHIARMVSVFMP